MTILHDAYLFEPEQFATAVRPYRGTLDMTGAARNQRVQLREDAIRLYDESPTVGRLAMEYAGWDRSSVLEVAANDDPEKPEDTAFWLVLILYDHLRTKPGTKPGEVGLRNKWEVFDKVLAALQWDKADRDLLIHGYSFARFPEKWLIGAPGLGTISNIDLRPWQHLHPFSTLARAGWLDSTDVLELLDKLRKDQEKLTHLPDGESIQATDEEVQQTYQRALDILEAARSQRSGLCLITSG